VKLQSRQLWLRWPAELPPARLRPWLLEQLRAHGEPLRWAITAVRRPDPQGSSGSDGELRVEAVLML
jgi:hypothetical protein